MTLSSLWLCYFVRGRMGLPFVCGFFVLVRSSVPRRGDAAGCRRFLVGCPLAGSAPVWWWL